MPVYLVRHAHAGNRAGWRGEDADRPLSDRGHAQAVGLAHRLGVRGIERISSSPARRCIQTVEPLADELGLEIELDERLAEGAAVRGALDLLLCSGPDTVLCAHGDLIPSLMHRLVSQGMRAESPDRCQKGSVWEIELDRGRPVKARYRAVPRA